MFDRSRLKFEADAEDNLNLYLVLFIVFDETRWCNANRILNVKNEWFYQKIALY